MIFHHARCARCGWTHGFPSAGDAMSSVIYEHVRRHADPGVVFGMRAFYVTGFYVVELFLREWELGVLLEEATR